MALWSVCFVPTNKDPYFLLSLEFSVKTEYAFICVFSLTSGNGKVCPIYWSWSNLDDHMRMYRIFLGRNTGGFAYISWSLHAFLFCFWWYLLTYKRYMSLDINCLCDFWLVLPFKLGTWLDWIQTVHSITELTHIWALIHLPINALICNSTLTFFSLTYSLFHNPTTLILLISQQLFFH